MHPEQIKAAIRMRGTTPSAIAQELGISRMAVSHVIHGRGVSAKVARAISQVTGIAIGVLWPDRYAATPRSNAKSVARSLLRSHS